MYFIAKGLALGFAGLVLSAPFGGLKAEAAPAPLDTTPCSFQVDPETHRELVAWSNYTKVKGTVQVWHRDKEWRSTNIAGGEWQFWNLKKRHADASHFQVAIIKKGTTHNNEHVWWCEEA